MKHQWLLWAILLVLPITGVAQVYKWVDDNGKVHYGDRLPDNVQQLDVRGDVNTVENQRYDFLPEPSTQPAAHSAVIMYASSWCPYCRKAREYFNNRGIPFTEYDIETNPEARRRFDNLGGEGVPLILVGRKRMSGFSAGRFERLYPD